MGGFFGCASQQNCNKELFYGTDYHCHLGTKRGGLATFNEEGFTRLANHLDLGSYLFLSNAEINNKGREKPSLLSNAFEAIIGAIYLEAGLETAREISIKLLEECHPKIDLDSLSKDYKTALQELTQATHGVTPSYTLLDSSGPDHKKEFVIAVILDEKTIATAKGKSKKEAQQKAAELALKELKA